MHVCNFSPVPPFGPTRGVWSNIRDFLVLSLGKTIILFSCIHGLVVHVQVCSSHDALHAVGP